MFEDFKKWISCAACIKTTLAGLKGLLIAVGPTVIALGPILGYQTGEVEKIIATVTTIVGLVLTVLDKTSAAMVRDAKDIEGVQVHVDTSINPDTQKSFAPSSVVKLAEGPMPDVFPMVGGPRQPTDHEDKT